MSCGWRVGGKSMKSENKRTYFHNSQFYLYVCKHVTFVHHKLSSWQPKKISSASVGDYSSIHNKLSICVFTNCFK